jgi:mono/diheme cytochrome c family protein
MQIGSTRRWLAGASAVLLASLFFCAQLQGHAQSAQSQSQPAGSSIAAGAKVYANMCGQCHNPRSPLERNDRDWVTIISHMRVRGNLTGEQAREVVAFLQASNGSPSPAALPSSATAATSQFSDAVSADPQIIAQGQTFVTEKACIGCHLIGSQGGRLGPSLNGAIERRGAAFVRHKLTNPSFNNATSTMPNLGLLPGQIDAIVAYLKTLPGGQ